MTQLTLTPDFKTKVTVKLLEQRKLYGGSDSAFAKQYDINASVFSQIKNGKVLDGLIRESQWLQLGRELGVNANKRNWIAAKTEVFNRINEDILFCKGHSKAMVLVDDCAIGKTFSAKYLSKSLDNCFYIDASQAKTRQAFIRLFAKVIGVDSTDKFVEVKNNIKYYLSSVLQRPVVIVDEAGDLEYNAFLELKELWNATDGTCGWYMMGADGLRHKIERGISNHKVGYREIFSRYSNKFGRVTPTETTERRQFYHNLITAVLSANCPDKALVPQLVKKCLASETNGEYGGLRRAESLLIISNKN